MNFSIRDLFWLTLTVGLGTGWVVSNYSWWRSSQAADAERVAVTRQAIKLRDVLRLAKKENDRLEDRTLRALRAADDMRRRQIITGEHIEIDWTVLDEPIPDISP
jgi:hypothetical protein